MESPPAVLFTNLAIAETGSCSDGTERTVAEKSFEDSLDDFILEDDWGPPLAMGDLDVYIVTAVKTSSNMEEKRRYEELDVEEDTVMYGGRREDDAGSQSSNDHQPSTGTSSSDHTMKSY